MGITPPAQDPQTAPFNHSPRFHVDEAGLRTGICALLAVTAEALAGR
jgi:hypothetical protein